MNKDNFKILIEKYQDSHDEYSKSYYNFFKTLTTICIGLLGLLIGLKPKEIPCFDTKISFLVSIFLIVLCILSSLIVQHQELFVKKGLIDSMERIVISYIENPEGDKLYNESAPTKKIYLFFEKATFVCLALSMVALIFYVYFSEF